MSPGRSRYLQCFESAKAHFQEEAKGSRTWKYSMFSHVTAEEVGTVLAITDLDLRMGTKLRAANLRAPVRGAPS